MYYKIKQKILKIFTKKEQPDTSCGCFHKKYIQNLPKRIKRKNMIYIVQNKEDFNECLKNAGEKLVVIDFFANWCGPCKIINPTLEGLATKYAEEAVVLKVNVDDCDDITMDYNVISLPTFIFMKKGKIMNKIVGSNAESLIKNMEKYICGDDVPSVDTGENDNEMQNENENAVDENEVGATPETTF